MKTKPKATVFAKPNRNNFNCPTAQSCTPLLYSGGNCSFVLRTCGCNAIKLCLMKKTW